jgi:DNA-binding CsgD family transcriptional regulator
LERTYQTTSPASTSLTNRRGSRAKKHLAWEQAELESHGYYAQNLIQITERFPSLTQMERRVAALAKAMLKNYEIAEKLGITEKTVENHRRNIRQKLGIGKNDLIRVLLLNN